MCVKNKKVLVTGGAGYIGSLLVPELINQGYNVRVLDNLMYNQIPFLTHFIDDNFEFINGDIRDVEKVKKSLDGVDFIIHLAAIVGAPACKKNPALAEDINYNGTVNINNSRLESQRLIYASTGSVYGKVKEICTEDCPTNPLSVYGETKLKAEKAVMEKGNAIAYRFATAFGLSPRLRLDLMPNDFVFKALKDRHIVVYDKDFYRTFIHIRDIVRSYIFAIEHFEEMKNNFYNVGSEIMNKSKGEIVQMIKNKIDFEVYYADMGISDPDQRDYEVSYQKIKKVGFETVFDFNKGFDELIKGLNPVNIYNPFLNI